MEEQGNRTIVVRTALAASSIEYPAGGQAQAAHAPRRSVSSRLKGSSGQ